MKTNITEKLDEALEKLYRQGFIDGMRCFAHWKDGVQYVGTTGIRLDDAIEKVTELFHYNPRAYFSAGSKKKD